MDGIVIKAWKNMYVPGVIEALATFVASRLKHHDGLIKGGFGKTDHLIFREDEDKRHRLLEAVFQVVARTSEVKATWLLFTHTPLVFPEDFEWLISCLDLNPAKEVQVVIVNLMERLFKPTPEHLDAIHEASNRHQLMADKFKSIWEPILLGSENAQKMKASHEEHQEWTKTMEERPPLTPPPTERVSRLLEECENRNVAAWCGLIGELSLEPTSTHYGSSFEWDLMKLPGWLSADETIRKRIVVAAEKFVLSQPHDSSDWLGTGEFSLLVLSGYSALALLLNMKPAVIDSLTADQIGKWCPIILTFPFSGDECYRAVKDELLKIAYRKSQLAVLDVAKILIEKEIEKGETIGTASELNAIWDDQIANALLQYAKRSELKPKSMSSLLSVLFSHDNLEAQLFASSLVPTPPPVCDPERAQAVAAAQTLMLDTKDVGWSIVWPAMQADEDFGKQVILGVCSDYESMGSRLNEDQLADLYVWLTHHFKVPEHKSGEAHRVGPLEYIDLWRNAIIQLLTHRGSFRACEAIKKLQQELPELDWLKWVQVDAGAEARRATWVPAQPQDIIKLAADHELRLVQSGDQLMQVLVESLERFQSLLQGETPEAPYLWDNVSKSDAKPKDENSFSDYAKIHLEKDLKQRGIVLNREVRIHRGQRTDIHVNAVIQTASGHPYDSITVIIECKGCWNPGLYDAMRDQLVGMYLKDNHCQHGLYLVGWFNCGNWSEEDGRKKQAGKLCPTIDYTRQRLAAFAEDLSKDSTRIKSVVLDVSLR